MAINKNFVIKNGAEINTKLFVADANTQKIGIGTTTPSYDLHVFGAAGNGGIGATFVNVTGITTTQALNVLGVSTFNTGPILVARGELTGTSSQSLQVGTATTVSGVYVSGNIGVGQTLPNAKLEVVPTASEIAGLFSGTTSADLVRITQLGSGNALVIEDSANPDVTSVVVSGLGSVGVGTNIPRFLLDIDTTTSTGTTAVYIRGDVKITGDLSADDLIFDQASLTTLEVVGFSTLGSVRAGNIILAGITTGLNAPGISTLGDTTISDLFLAGITTGLNASGISTIGNLLVTPSASGIGATVGSTAGIITYFGDGSNLTGVSVGILSAGNLIGFGVTTLNFVGSGNTFLFNTATKTVDISIAGGGGKGGFSTHLAGIATISSVGVNTSNLDDPDLTGIGNSFQGLYIGNGMLIVDNQLNGNHYIGTNFNGLMAGPVTINGTLTIDGNYVVV